MPVRPAREEDLSRIAEIFLYNNRLHFFPIFREEAYSFGELQAVSLARDFFAPRLKDLAVSDDGICRGFVLTEGEEIVKLYVDPFFQNRGIGRELLAYAVNRGGRRLWALEKNVRAIAFYERCGFALTGEKTPEEDTTEWLLRMELGAGLAKAGIIAPCGESNANRAPVPRPVLRTERLLLREMAPGDFEALRQVLADSDIMRHYPYPFDEKRIRGWIEKNIRRYESLGFGLWALCLGDTGEMIGDCGLTMQVIDGDILPEIGYHLRRDMQHRGYAAEAASACIGFAFRNAPFRVVCSYMKKANAPSAAVAMRCGMTLRKSFEDAEGETSLVYGITRGAWEEQERARLKG